MIRNFILRKQSDIDGFNSFKCSLCGEEFKLDAGECQKDDVLEIFCPGCGIPSPKSSYLTDDFKENAMIIAENEAIKVLNEWAKKMERSFNGKSGLTFKAGKSLPTKPVKTMYELDDIDHIEFICCNRKAKLAKLTIISSNPYCPYCGGN